MCSPKRRSSNSQQESVGKCDLFNGPAVEGISPCQHLRKFLPVKFQSLVRDCFPAGRHSCFAFSERQTLALGRALMADPEVLLLGEPSLGLHRFVSWWARRLSVMLNPDGRFLVDRLSRGFSDTGAVLLPADAAIIRVAIYVAACRRSRNTSATFRRRAMSMVSFSEAAGDASPLFEAYEARPASRIGR